MRKPAALYLAAMIVVVPTCARAQAEPDVLPSQVQAAKACAVEAATVRDAYRVLSNHLRVRGDVARAEVLLSEAEDALARARSQCRDDAEALRSFEQLATDSAVIRRALAGPSR